jgi:hypothetical protein
MFLGRHMLLQRALSEEHFGAAAALKRRTIVALVTHMSIASCFRVEFFSAGSASESRQKMPSVVNVYISGTLGAEGFAAVVACWPVSRLRHVDASVFFIQEL